MSTSDEIESLLKENRVFPPDPEFAKKAHVKSAEERAAMTKAAAEDPEGFWAGIARELHWFEPWTKVLEWNVPFAEWFVGGKTNIAYNCIDRHCETWRRNKAAIVWEGEPGDSRVLTFADLQREVSKFANVLKSLGVETGDRVGVYMPMVPELAITILACARIGATHSVVFGGFSSDALRDRMNDAEAKVVVTADGGYRRGGIVDLKVNVDTAVEECPTVESVVVVQRTGQDVTMKAGRDVWWHERMAEAGDVCPAEQLDAEHPLLIPLHLRYHREAEGRGSHHRRLHGAHVRHQQVGFRPQGRGHLLLYRRHRLGHRPQLFGVRNPRQRRDVGDVRGRPQLSGPRPSLADHRQVRCQHLLHRADRDSLVHQVGQRASSQVPLRSSAPARHGRRADQSGSVDVVP